MARRGSGPEVVTIYWRDIPAQVNGQVGRERHQVVLSGKFQRAIDRAKRKAKIYTAEGDIAQWRRTTAACDGDPAAAADAEAARLEAEYSRDFLGRLAYAGGWQRDVAADAVDGAALLALEELDDEPPSATTTTTTTTTSTTASTNTAAADGATTATDTTTGTTTTDTTTTDTTTTDTTTTDTTTDLEHPDD